ncbi:hypothetical protein ACS386_07795 [Flavobacteriaceae bacterium LMO-SS05]
MELKQIIYPQGDEYYNKELVTRSNAGITTTFGTVFLKKGTRIPVEGFSRHPFNEVSIITEGCIEMLNEDGSISGYLKADTAVYINALEPQAGNVIEDTRLIYIINQKT